MEAPPSTLLPVPEALPCAQITVWEGGNVLFKRVLTRGHYTIGRDASCDLVVNVEGVSTRHATLSLGDATSRVHDLDSETGTFIDGQRVALMAPLRNGETVSLGIVASVTLARVLLPQFEHEAGAASAEGYVREPFDSGSTQTHLDLGDLASSGGEKSALSHRLAKNAGLADKAFPGHAELEKLRGKVTFLSEAREILLQQLSTAAERLHLSGRCSPEEADYLRREVAELEQCLTRALEQRRHLEERCKTAERAARRTVENSATVRKEKPKSDGPWVRVAAMLAMLLVTGTTFILISTARRNAVERARRAEDIAAKLRPFADDFRRQAVENLERHAPAEALARIACAIGLNPDNADYHLVHGHICESVLRIGEARAAYARASKLDPHNAVAKENLLLCDRILATRAAVPTEQSLYGLHRLMMRQERFGEALSMAARLAHDGELLRETWEAILHHGGLSGSLTRLNDGTFALNLSSAPSSSLAALAGMPLSALDLSRSAVTDLSPLAGLPLRALDISHTRIRDLSPLRGLPLQRLNIADTSIIDLDPLKDVPLEQLDISRTDVGDLAALSRMPLRVLRMAGTPVRDMAVLAGVPLRELDASRTRVVQIGDLHALPLEMLRIDDTDVEDLTPIAGAPLRHLSVAHTRVSDLTPLRNSGVRVLDLSGCKGIETVQPLGTCSALERLIIPRQCRDAELLKNLRTLRFLSFESDDAVSQYDQTASEFWRAYGGGSPEPINGRLRSSSPSDNPPLSPP